MSFECCRHCVAPKRHPGCHATCPEYPIALKQHRREQEYLNRHIADKYAIELHDKVTTKYLKSQYKYKQRSGGGFGSD